MATILAANTGNWSATGTWTGGVVPVAGDIVVANGKTIAIDTLNVTVAEVRNDTTGGAAVGGVFNMVSGGSLTANVYAGGTTNCIGWAGTAGQTATITGNIFAGSGASAAGIYATGAGNLTIGGGSTVTGGTGSSNGAQGILFASTGTLTFATAGNPGIITGGSSTQAGSPGISCTTVNSTVNIYASTITANASGPSPGCIFGSNQTVSIVAGSIQNANGAGGAISVSSAVASLSCTVSGNIQGGASSNAHGVYINASSGTYTFTVAGSILGGTGNSAQGIANTNITSINIVGNIIGTSVGNGNNYGAVNSGAGTTSIAGSATAGTGNGACLNSSTGTLRVTRAIGNGFGLGSVGINNVAAVVSGTSGSLTYVEQLQFGSLGNTPVSGPIRLTANTGNVCQFTTTTGSIKTLIDTAATSGILPVAGDVRSGTVYSSGNITGTCSIPNASTVAFGTPVDNTTGTAVLTPASLRTALGMNSANMDTQLKNLKNTTIAAGLLG